MIDKKLLENVSRLGFPLMETENDLEVNHTLADVVGSRDMRLWEGFPVLLANAARDHDFDYDRVLKVLTKKKEREDFHELVLLSTAVYQHYKLSFTWLQQLKKHFSNRDMGQLKKLNNMIAHGDEIVLNRNRFHASRVIKSFDNYFKEDAQKTRQLKERHEELSVEYALSQLLSPKQKELFRKKLKGEPLNKTEREYYSRSVKKKIAALANPELTRLAQKLMEY